VFTLVVRTAAYTEMSSETDVAGNDSVALMRAITEGKNPRGIPGARFIVSFITHPCD
jgi:hypothetical protein